MKALLVILITIMAMTSQAQTDKEIQIKRIKAEGRAARYAFNVYKKKVDTYQAKIDGKTKTITEKKNELKSLYVKAKCRGKEGCKHSRDMSCYKMKRTLDRTLAMIKKEKLILERYEKQYKTNKKFMDKKKAYIEELIQMLKE